MNCSKPGLPVRHQLPEFTQTHVHWGCDAIHPTISFVDIPFSCLQSFPESGSFPVSQFFTSGGQSIGVSALPSVLPMNIQDWSPLGWTGWISLQSKGLSRVLQHHSWKASVYSFWCAFMYIVLSMFFENSFRFTAKLIKREMLHIHSLPTHPQPLPLSASPTAVVHLWSIDEPALTCPHHPQL